MGWVGGGDKRASSYMDGRNLGRLRAYLIFLRYSVELLVCFSVCYSGIAFLCKLMCIPAVVCLDDLFVGAFLFLLQLAYFALLTEPC